MKYLFDVDKTGSTTARLLNLAVNCIFAGAFTGVAIALFGYAPRALVLAIIPYAIFLGGLGGGAFAFLVCYFVFAEKLSNATYRDLGQQPRSSLRGPNTGCDVRNGSTNPGTVFLFHEAFHA
jgi:hypothetical protein